MKISAIEDGRRARGEFFLATMGSNRRITKSTPVSTKTEYDEMKHRDFHGDDRKPHERQKATNKMNLSEQPHPWDRKSDWSTDEFPGLRGQCATLVEDADEVLVSELVRRAALFKRMRRPVLAARCLFQAMRTTKDLGEKARFALTVGVLAETVGKFEVAVSFYQTVIALQPSGAKTRYFARNNLGYSLNQLGLYEEGEIYCRDAVNINPELPNGHKNLGLSLWGQQRFRESALCFVDATRANALDPRSTQHLADLLAERPEIAEEFSGALAWCRNAVREARIHQSGFNGAKANRQPGQQLGNFLN